MSLIYLKLISIHDRRVQLHSFTCGYPVFPTPFVEKTLLSLMNGLTILIKNHLTIYTRVYFCTLFYFVGLYVCLYSSTKLFWLHNFVVNFIIEKHEAFFSIVLAIQGPLQFHMNFRMNFSVSAKNVFETLMGIAVDL